MCETTYAYKYQSKHRVQEYWTERKRDHILASIHAAENINTCALIILISGGK